MTARTSLPSTRMLGMPKPEARSASWMWDCSRTGSEMAQWLFWQKKTTGRLEARGEDHGFVDVAFARGAVAEVGHGDAVGAVVLDAHGVAGGVQASARR